MAATVCTQCQAPFKLYTCGPRPQRPDLCGRCRHNVAAKSRYQARQKCHATMQDGVPLCTRCGRCPAKPHHAVGFYRMCGRCSGTMALRRVRGKDLKCVICGNTFQPPRAATCSTACATIAQRMTRRRHKVVIVAALGSVCGCSGGTDCWHAGACEVRHIDALTVDHTYRDGAHVRRRRRDGSMVMGGRDGSGQWSRYRRALMLPNHGMQLRCFNCHQVSDNRHRRSHLKSAA